MDEKIPILPWIGWYALNSLFWWWIIAWGGAKRIEGWKAFFLIRPWAALIEAEGLRLLGLIIWLGTTVLFVLGIFVPDIRGFME